MPEDVTTRRPDAEPEEYVTLLSVQQEVGLTRGTLKKYLALLAHLRSTAVPRASD